MNHVFFILTHILPLLNFNIYFCLSLFLICLILSKIPTYCMVIGILLFCIRPNLVSLLIYVLLFSICNVKVDAYSNIPIRLLDPKLAGIKYVSASLLLLPHNYLRSWPQPLTCFRLLCAFLTYRVLLVLVWRQTKGANNQSTLCPTFSGSGHVYFYLFDPEIHCNKDNREKLITSVRDIVMMCTSFGCSNIEPDIWHRWEKYTVSVLVILQIISNCHVSYYPNMTYTRDT